MKSIKDNFITSQNQDFTQWYKDVCHYASLFNYGPVKGTIIFRPYAWAIWEGIVKYLNKCFGKLEVNNVYLPMMIPKSLFKQEQEHIAGFNPELLTVTKYGDRLLPEELYIRPTSEILMAQEFAQIIKSHRDLPVKYNQWCNVMRWEKNTKPFLRTSEFVWQEGHTAHAQPAEAKAFAQTILNIYIDLAEKILAIPVIAGEKTSHERFAGALNSYTIESIMHDGQALQCGTSHYFGNKFSKIFNIKYEDAKQQLKYPTTTSWGVSTRLLGAIIMTHGDDRGLKMPFPIAPVQIQIITPPKIKSSLKDYIEKIIIELKPHYRVQFLKSQKSFGFQISEAEVRGVPLRLEIGSRDCQANQITIARRDINDKILIKRQDLLSALSKLAKAYQKNLYEIAATNLQNKIIKVNSYQDYCDKITQANIMVLMPFCTKTNCERIIKNETQTTSRCIPFTANNKPLINKKCWRCGEQALAWTYFAKAY